MRASSVTASTTVKVTTRGVSQREHTEFILEAKPRTALRFAQVRALALATVLSDLVTVAVIGVDCGDGNASGYHLAC